MKRAFALAMSVIALAVSSFGAQQDEREAAKIAAKYWNQPVDLVEYSLKTPADRIQYNKYVPKEEEIRYLAEQMARFGLINDTNIDGLVDDSFAKSVDLGGIQDVKSIIPSK